MTSRAIDRHHRRERVLASRSTARWHPEKSVAILCRSMDPRTTACVNPKMKAVALVEPCFSAPRRLTFSSNGNLDRHSARIPPKPNVCKNFSVREFGKARNLVDLRKANALAVPLAIPVSQGNLHAEEESRINEGIRHLSDSFLNLDEPAYHFPTSENSISTGNAQQVASKVVRTRGADWAS